MSESISEVLVKKSNTLPREVLKLFEFILNKYDGSGILILDKKEIFEALGLNDNTKRYTTLKRNVTILKTRTWYSVGDVHIFNLADVIKSIDSTRESIIVTFNNLTLDELDKFKKLNYLPKLIEDKKDKKSKYSPVLTTALKNKKVYTTDELKELFNISETAYNYDGNFNRALFEKYTINAAIRALEKTHVITYIKNYEEDNKRLVKNYEFEIMEKEKEKDTANEKKEKKFSFWNKFKAIFVKIKNWLKK